MKGYRQYINSPYICILLWDNTCTILISPTFQMNHHLYQQNIASTNLNPIIRAKSLRKKIKWDSKMLHKPFPITNKPCCLFYYFSFLMSFLITPHGGQTRLYKNYIRFKSFLWTALKHQMKHDYWKLFSFLQEYGSNNGGSYNFLFLKFSLKNIRTMAIHFNPCV